LNVNSEVSIDGRLFVNRDASFNSSISVGSDVSIGGRLFVNRDASFNSSISVGSDVSIGGRIFVNRDASFNSSVSVGSDVSIGGRIFVNRDASFNSNISNSDTNIYNSFVSSSPPFASEISEQGISAISATGQYISLLGYTKIYLSSDYGATQSYSYYTNNYRPNSFSKITSVAISDNGEYQIITTYNITNSGIGNLYVSSDYGATFIGKITSVSNDYIGCAISSTGQYISTITSNYNTISNLNDGSYNIYVSSNYGSSWTIPAFKTDNGFANIAMSSTGQYQTVVSTYKVGYFNTSSAKCYVSSDYGKTGSWNLKLNLTEGNNFKSISMSSSGQYQTICGYIPDMNYSKNIFIYSSDDYGNTWTPQYSSSSNQANIITVSSSGQYQFAATFDASYILVSTSYGTNWYQNTNFSPPRSNINNIRISRNGNYILFTASYSSFQYTYRYYVAKFNCNNYISTNNLIAPGFSITPGYVNIQGITTIEGNLTVTKSATIGGTFYTSDYRIKSNIEQLNGSYTVQNLIPRKYYNDQLNKYDFGLIAHELQEQYPILVEGRKDGENYQSVNYIGLIPLLINDIQQQQQQITNLANKLELAEETISEQSKTISDLQSQIDIINNKISSFIN
jgi:UDP-3-O-[3-hydroxymyristoyl] glucosamine N-acyltransferase